LNHTGDEEGMNTGQVDDSDKTTTVAEGDRSGEG